MPVAVAVVPHERDRRGVGAERRARQREPARGALERLAHRVAPGQRVTAVVHLVEDHQRGRGRRPRGVQRGLAGHLRVGHRDAVEPVAVPALGVAEVGVERDADARGRVGPLPLEVLGGRDHRHPPDQLRLEQLGRDPQGERRLAGAGRGHREEVARVRRPVLLDRLRLPGAQLARRPPRRTRGERRRQLGGRRRGRVGRGEGGRARGGRHAPPLPGLRPKPHLRPPPEPLPPSFLSPSCGSRRPS